MTEPRRYADHRPYPDPPGRLADLTGPTSGVVELPITIDWGPKRSYDLGRQRWEERFPELTRAAQTWTNFRIGWLGSGWRL